MHRILFGFVLLASTALAQVPRFRLHDDQPRDGGWGIKSAFSDWSRQNYNHIGSQPGHPYEVTVDTTTAGALRWGLNTGLGDGYRGDMIIFWVEAVSPYYGFRYEIYNMSEGTTSSPRTRYAASQEEMDQWISEQEDANADIAIQIIDRPTYYGWEILGFGGTPRASENPRFGPSEVYNDIPLKHTHLTGQFEYDITRYGGRRVIAELITFQRTRENESIYDINDRGEWRLPPRPPGIRVQLGTRTSSPSASLLPTSQTIYQGRSATLSVSSTNGSSVGARLFGHNVEVPNPTGTVVIRPLDIGMHTYAYTVFGTVGPTKTWVTL